MKQQPVWSIARTEALGLREEGRGRGGWGYRGYLGVGIRLLGNQLPVVFLVLHEMGTYQWVALTGRCAGE